MSEEQSQKPRPLKIVDFDTVTPATIKKFLEYVIKTIKESKDAFSTDAQAKLELIGKVIKEMEGIKTGLSDTVASFNKDNEKRFTDYDNRFGAIDSRHNKFNDDFKEKYKQLYEFTRKTLIDVQNAENKPISDEERNRIIDETIKRIGSSDDEVSGQAIIDAINNMAIDDPDQKIDAVHIKNLPEIIGKRLIGIGGARLLSLLNDVSIKGITAGQTIVWDGNKFIPGSGGGGSGNFVDNEVVSGTTTTWTLVQAPTAGSVHLYANGQRLIPIVDFTITGAVITTSLSWTAGTVLADYRY